MECCGGSSKPWSSGVRSWFKKISWQGRTHISANFHTYSTARVSFRNGYSKQELGRNTLIVLWNLRSLFKKYWIAVPTMMIHEASQQRARQNNFHGFCSYALGDAKPVRNIIISEPPGCDKQKTSANVIELGNNREPAALNIPVIYIPRLVIAPWGLAQRIGPRVR